MFIYKELIKESRFKNINPPELKGSFSTIYGFLKDLIDIAPSFKILFVLDDFDYLPLKLYHPGEVSESFFTTIKALSSDENFGFILVGGERMEYMNDRHGDKINLFKWRPVDYFHKEKFNDYNDSVVKPVAEYQFEFTEDSIFCLYDYTAGNPYFTNLICQNLFSIMLERRDCHITRIEVDLAVKKTISSEKGSSFAHFWEDGILNSDIKAKTEIENDRKKFLIAYSKALRQTGLPDLNLLLEKADELGGVNIKKIIEDFTRRSILIEQKTSNGDDAFILRVPFFREWLKEKGPFELRDAFTDQAIIYKTIMKDEEERISSDEIIELAEKWGSYKGLKISEDSIRRWLDQFPNNYHQRLMFKILRNIKFYTVPILREKMVEAYSIVKIKLKEKETWKKSEILVSYIGEYGKSSSRYAQLFRDQNGIPSTNIVEYSKIKEFLENRESIKALVFIDDFIGTGEQAKEYLKRINEEYGEIFNNDGLQIFYIVIAGFQEALIAVEEFLPKLNFKLNFHILDNLENKEKCFHKSSTIFANNTEREHALRIVEDKGSGLVKNAPLGYKNCQAIIVFSDSCPNDTIPILWAKSQTWKPLFIRTI